MALLELKDIGKIYVSDGNVAVGIRGVNLSFNRGEFVAVTGKSGSGKSTLLNVISGMDSYEEGELYIEGQSTSHYLQPEWEEYRERYISFIFQDYNIIESFTVLQNVELALMHMEDKKERRKRALELLDRVGLSSHVNQKGSRLSGGQKQRTVIARALAKDSPIILADEPTGNLDSTTSAEIIELLREVSKDKLLIVVTHNFEQVEKYATRHIRIFDGAVESDHVIVPPEKKTVDSVSPLAQKNMKHRIKNGITLGKTIFTAKPKLSVFLCLLMIIGTLGIFIMTAFCGEAGTLFEDNLMFEYVEGRVVVTKRSGEPITDEELQKLVTDTGAKSFLHFDKLLDAGYTRSANYYFNGDREYLQLKPTYEENYGDKIIGRYPEAENEVLLYLPISYQPHFGKNSLMTEEIEYMNLPLKVTGVKYYYDNNLTPRALFTKKGFDTMTSIFVLMDSSFNVNAYLMDGSERVYNNSYYSFTPSFSLEEGKVYISDSEFNNLLAGKVGKPSLTPNVQIQITYYNYNYNYDYGSKGELFVKEVGAEHIAKNMPPELQGSEEYYGKRAIISVSLLKDMADEFFALSYRQASLFYENDDTAYQAVQALKDAGYIAVPSDTTYVPDALTTILETLTGLMFAFMWVLGILFLAFFINLCTSRTLSAFKGEMAIMRSMGIQVRVIQIGMYVRMLISLIPAYIMVILTAILIFTTPKFNEFFTYLYAWQYALIFIGMLLLTVRITYKQIKKLFGETVKKSLKGGAAE